MSNPYVMWAIICLATAAALFIVEIFVPSGGLIGIIAGVALVAGVTLLFMVDTTVGLVGAIVVLGCVPIFIGLAIKIWPNTPIARMLTLSTSQPPAQSANQPTAAPVMIDETALVQVGMQGKALTELRPVGVCVFAGKRCDCLAAGPMIPAGTVVKVIEIDGMQIKVRPV